MPAHEPQVAPAASEAAGEARLRREVGLFLGVAITVNAMIGTGIFRHAPKIVRLSGSIEGGLAAWALGGLVSLAGALCVGALGAAMPRSGGLYEYLRRAYGPTTAFVFGWARLVLLGPSAAGGFSRLAAIALTSALGLSPDPSRETLLAMGVLAFCIFTNLAGVRTSSVEQAVVTSLKYLGTLGLAVACLALPILPRASLPAPAPSATPVLALTAGGFLAALVKVMWAYDGWGDLSSLGGEVKRPERTMPRALLLGVSAVTLVYILVNLAYARTLGLTGILASEGAGQLVATNAIAMTLGELGRRALAGLVFVSCVGACMVGVLTGSRVFVPMASDGLFFRALGAVSTRGVPARAVVFTGVLGAAYVAVRSFEQLTDSFVVGAFPFYFLAVLAVFVLRRDPEIAREIRVPFYPVAPIVFLVGATMVMWGGLQDVEGIAYFAFGLLLLGVPVGLAWQQAGRRRMTRGMPPVVEGGEP